MSCRSSEVFIRLNAFTCRNKQNQVGSFGVLVGHYHRQHEYHGHHHFDDSVRKGTVLMLLGLDQVLHPLFGMLDTLVEVVVYAVDQTPLVNHQLVHLFVNVGQLIDGCNQLVYLLVPFPLYLLVDLDLVLVILELLSHLVCQMDGPVLSLPFVVLNRVEELLLLDSETLSGLSNVEGQGLLHVPDDLVRGALHFYSISLSLLECLSQLRIF